MFTEADLIHSYTRAQAIEDGVLFDAGPMALEAGFKVPVALTTAVFEDCVAWTEQDEQHKPCGQSADGRLWDVLWMSYNAARRTDGSQVHFPMLRIPCEGPAFEPTRVNLVLAIGPGDEGEPVCTIMLPGED